MARSWPWPHGGDAGKGVGALEPVQSGSGEHCADQHDGELAASQRRVVLPEVAQDSGGVGAEQVVSDAHSRGSAERCRLGLVDGGAPRRDGPGCGQVIEQPGDQAGLGVAQADAPAGRLVHVPPAAQCAGFGEAIKDRTDDGGHGELWRLLPSGTGPYLVPAGGLALL
jgi:hypothetical protein